jgi:hypothetical protein
MALNAPADVAGGACLFPLGLLAFNRRPLRPVPAPGAAGYRQRSAVFSCSVCLRMDWQPPQFIDSRLYPREQCSVALCSGMCGLGGLWASRISYSQFEATRRFAWRGRFECIQKASRGACRGASFMFEPPRSWMVCSCSSWISA